MLARGFLEWIEQAAPEERLHAVQDLAIAYCTGGLNANALIDAEMAILFLLDSADEDIRVTISEVFAIHVTVDHSIIIGLANDSDRVADPIIAYSTLLSENELRDIFSRRSEALQCAIAARRGLSAGFCHFIAQEGESGPCRALLRNTSCHLAPYSLRAIAHRHLMDRDIRMLLGQRKDLDIDLRQMLLMQLGEDMLKELGPSAPALSAARIEEAKDRATLVLCEDANLEDVIRLVEHMRETSQLTPSFLLRAVCSVQTPVIVCALANLSSTSVDKASRSLFNSSWRKMKSLWQKAGVSLSVAFAIEAAMEVLRSVPEISDYSQSLEFRKLLVDRVVLRCEGMNNDPEMQPVIALLRRIQFDIARQDARQQIEENVG